jgi:filamentous hemagglutinin family protein
MGVFAAVALAGGGDTCHAQVVLDGKFGTSGALAGPNYTITAGMGLTRGNNLFQSFSQFDLKAGDIATFTGPANVQNILGRVTGGKASSIDGTIRSGISGANFYFINPSGILFGPNGTVDVSGSFAASTANYLKLADGARFVAALDADDSGLSTAPVSAFGFLGNNPGSLTVQQSTLKVADGKSISLVGGDVTVDGGSVQSPGGDVKVVSVHSPGEVPTDPTTLSIPQFNAAFPEQGQINVQNSAQLDASGEGGGRIVIRGGHLTVDNAQIQANTTGATAGRGIDIAVVNDLNVINGGQINALSPAGLGAGGNINLNSGSIRLDGAGLVDANGNPSTQISSATGDPATTTGGPAKGGDIVIQTGQLELANSAQISSSTWGAGNAGKIDITASSVQLDARLTTVAQITANTQAATGAGNAGDISIHTGTLEMLNGATMLAATFGSGQAGLVDINAHSVNLRYGGIITAGTFGNGNGGNVQITADTMHVSGQATVSGQPDSLTGIQAITTSTDAPAPGGSLHITTGSLDLEHMGSLYTTSYGNGPGGDVEVKTGQLTLTTGSSLSASSQGSGSAGRISVSVDKSVGLTGGSSITTSAPQSSGGDISVQAGHDITLVDSQISSQAGPGGGGNITTTAPNQIYLLRGTFNAQAEGNGGNLTMSYPDFIILNQGGLISKSSTQNGGNITLLSDVFFQSESVIDASAPFGIPGTVRVSAPEIDLSGSLVALPNNLLSAEALLRPDCGVRLSGNVSSFIVLGRGGLPLDPSGFVPSSGPILHLDAIK